MKKVIVLLLLALIPLFTWGHVKSHVGMGFSYYLYTACYLGLGWSRKWTGLPAWKHHLIALVPLVYLSGFLLIDSPDVYFPIFTPLLFLVGFFGYLAGWNLIAHKVPSLTLIVVLIGLIGTWRLFLPEVLDWDSERWHQRNAYPEFVGKRPELRFENETGTMLGPETFKDKVVVLDFWFSGCGYCIEKFKLLNQVKNHFANDGRVLIASVADGNYDTRVKFAQMIAKYPYITKPALYDPEGQFVGKYGISKRGYAFEMRLDHTSTVFAVALGNEGELTGDYYVKKLITQIEEKLKEIQQ
jgi:thiol-disulfide isomerase/thioredoxin